MLKFSSYSFDFSFYKKIRNDVCLS